MPTSGNTCTPNPMADLHKSCNIVISIPQQVPKTTTPELSIVCETSPPPLPVDVGVEINGLRVVEDNDRPSGSIKLRGADDYYLRVMSWSGS
ncbi:hypothetical protein CEXT_238411 [Caerostris extrusa]|uniref:Uncharacterized protein n=1 Tax=Caerostris extrusa TaxID=172846 RepID=A0AAV4T1E7_CAEEX|nr:hypothetical protein CEXT_238411 [Caerostris extrusa]